MLMELNYFNQIKLQLLFNVPAAPGWGHGEHDGSNDHGKIRRVWRVLSSTGYPVDGLSVIRSLQRWLFCRLSNRIMRPCTHLTEPFRLIKVKSVVGDTYNGPVEPTTVPLAAACLRQAVGFVSGV